MNKRKIFLLLICLFIVSCVPKTTSMPQAAHPSPTLAVHCHVRGALPDAHCTPGAVIPGVTMQKVCTPGYARSVRNVPESEKQAVYKEYGIIRHVAGAYEVDHLISLELGGSNAITNLWPEAAKPTPGYHEKDKAEDYLHSQVCSGKMTLVEAQKKIAMNWLAVYKQTLVDVP